MSVVEDIRQVFQDFITPELCEIRVRLDTQEKIAELRHNEIMLRIDGLKTSFELDKRLEQLGAKQAPAAQ